MSDKKNLFDALLNSDSKGIIEIYDLVFPSVLKYVIKNNGRTEDAEDVFQRALIHITTKIKVKNYQPIENFEWYLFGICKNLWLKDLNSQKKWVTKSNSEELYNEGIAKMTALEILENDRWEVYLRHFNMMSDNCKKILSAFLKKKPYAEITKELGYTSESVVRQRVFKCKSKLTKLIKTDPSYKKLKHL